MRIAAILAALAAVLAAQQEADLEREYKPVADREVIAYVNGIARRLVARPAEVRVLDTTESRAGAFRHGYVYLSAGLIQRAATEGELAAVLAHELAHAAAPDVFQFPFGLCARFQPDPTLAPLALKPRIEQSETDADRRARQYLAAAGYDPSLAEAAFRTLRRPSLRPRPPAPGRLGEIQARLK